MSLAGFLAGLVAGTAIFRHLTEPIPLEDYYPYDEDLCDVCKGQCAFCVDLGSPCSDCEPDYMPGQSIPGAWYGEWRRY